MKLDEFLKSLDTLDELFRLDALDNVKGEPLRSLNDRTIKELASGVSFHGIKRKIPKG